MSPDPASPDPVRAGRLSPDAPAHGEAFHELVRLGGVRVEHIVSSADPDPAEQVQAWDEWVLVLCGDARLELSGEVLELVAGAWVTLPAGTPHRVLSTRAGTHWLAVHVPPTGARQ